MMIFLVLFLVFCVASAWYFKNWMLGYGPHTAASSHGKLIDDMFNVTLALTGVVFVATHIALFYFAWKYHGRKGAKASFIAHNNTLEIIWSAIPAFVMTFLVVKGLVAWNEIMADIGSDEDYMEIEATGYQFAWHLRYPGQDGALGERNYKLISATNPVGQDWNDVKNLDDLHPSEIVLPVNKKVRVRITSRDVLHNFYLPQFRVKMDAVPGTPTYFVFTPTKTTEEYREELSKYPEYNHVKDPTDPDSKLMWEEFNYELACAELCGSSHFSMRRLVKIVSEEEYAVWLSQQGSYYLNTIRGTDADPFRGQVLDTEIKQRRDNFMTSVESALAATDESAKTIALSDISFETGGAQLTSQSRFAVQNLVDLLKKYPAMKIEVRGHTDNTGDAAANLELSKARANTVYQELVKNGIDASRLTATGYGDAVPLANNDTEDGRRQNRRTEFKILAQ
jgi:cytochrome c oxidase subunit 2